jgi:hypothetical protein
VAVLHKSDHLYPWHFSCRALLPITITKNLLKLHRRERSWVWWVFPSRIGSYFVIPYLLCRVNWALEWGMGLIRFIRDCWKYEFWLLFMTERSSQTLMPNFRCWMPECSNVCHMVQSTVYQKVQLMPLVCISNHTRNVRGNPNSTWTFDKWQYCKNQIIFILRTFLFYKYPYPWFSHLHFAPPLLDIPRVRDRVCVGERMSSLGSCYSNEVTFLA